MILKRLFRRDKPTAAVFIDFEHWCYSLDNLFGLKPRIEEFYDEISKEYYIKRICFFGDFSEPHLSSFIDEIRQVTNNIIETQNPSPYSKKDYTDFIMLDHIYQDVDDYPNTNTYIIFSGDGHFSSVATYLKKRKNKRVVIYGVTDATSRSLQKIADEFRLLPTKGDENWPLYKMIIDNMDYVSSQNRTVYATFKTTVKAVADKNQVSEDKVTAALRDLMDMGVIKQEMVHISFNKQIKVLRTDWKLAYEKGLWDYKDARPMN